MALSIAVGVLLIIVGVLLIIAGFRPHSIRSIWIRLPVRDYRLRVMYYDGSLWLRTCFGSLKDHEMSLSMFGLWLILAGLLLVLIPLAKQRNAESRCGSAAQTQKP